MLLVPVLLLLLFVSLVKTISAQTATKRVIVTFKEEASENLRDRIISRSAASRIKKLPLVSSHVVSANPAKIEMLKRDPNVLRVEEDAVVFALVQCQAPTILTHSDTNQSGGGTVSLTWSAVSGATQYRVQRQRTDGSWSTRQTGSSTSFTGADSSNDPDWRVFVHRSNGSCTVPGVSVIFDPGANIAPTPTPTPAPTLAPTPTPTPSSTQVLPWGVDRVDAEKVWAVTTADNIRVAVIDTGIDLDHPDLGANVKGGVNTIYPWRNADDDNGHGTHVAGIAAALNNTIGAVGVGPQIDLYAVKALDRRGSGYVSDIIEGIQWAINNDMDIINMSLGTTSDVKSFHDAVKTAKNAGIVIVSAAGNSGPGDNTVIYPAKYPESIAVSATTSSDSLASYSSRGPEVDLAAPGSSIYSTYNNGAYATLSGTSMAAPHAAGAAAMVLAIRPGFTPDQVEFHLETNAEWLSNLSSNQQGAGLVDVEKAVITP
jgi:hypothetical protein